MRTVKFQLTEEQAEQLHDEATEAAENGDESFRFGFECDPELTIEELEKRFPHLKHD